MSKDEIRRNWRPGDDSAVMRLLKEKHDIAVTRWAVAKWRKSNQTVRSVLAEKYIECFKIVQNRK